MYAFAEVIKNHVFLNEITACETKKYNPDHARNAWEIKTGDEYLIHGAAIDKCDV